MQLLLLLQCCCCCNANTAAAVSGPVTTQRPAAARSEFSRSSSVIKYLLINIWFIQRSKAFLYGNHNFEVEVLYIKP